MDLAQTIALVKKRQWQPIKAWLAQATPETAYERLKYLAYQIGPADIEGPIATLQTDHYGSVLQSALLYFLGGRARGGRLPGKMSDRQTFDYTYGLFAAHEGLIACLDANPDFGLAAAFEMGCAIDPFDDEHKDRAEAQLLRSTAVPLSGYMNLMMARSAKWGGDHATMFRVAHSRVDAARVGTFALIARAHFERRLFYMAFDEAPDASQRYHSYYDRDVMAELLDASATVCAASGQDAAEVRLADTWLAMTMMDAGKNRTAVKHLDRLGKFEDPTAWYIFNNAKMLRLMTRINAWVGR